MDSEEIRDRILVVFKRERKAPNADFDESNLHRFLPHPPLPQGKLKNSFSGAKRYYRFMNALEIEFGICFNYDDLDKEYSLDKLVKKVQDKIKNHRGNVMILERRMEVKNKYILEIVLVLVLALVFWILGLHWLPFLLAVPFGIVIGWTLVGRINDRRHNKKLAEILANKKSPAIQL